MNSANRDVIIQVEGLQNAGQTLDISTGFSANVFSIILLHYMSFILPNAPSKNIFAAASCLV